MSATTTPAHLLARPNSFLDSTQLQGIEGLDRWLLSTCCPIPIAIFEAVAKINEFRWVLHHQSHETIAMDESISPICTIQQIQQLACDVLNQLLNFSAERWASGIHSDHITGSESTDTVAQPYRHSGHAWTSLANCYRSAAIIYFLRSIQSVGPNGDSQEAQEKFEKETNRLLNEHRNALTSNLAFLFKPFEDQSESSSQHSLWNFIIWPLFIHAYDLVASSVPEDENVVQAKVIDHTLQRLHRVGKALGARCLFDAVRLLQQLVSRRVKGQSWNWDDGFPGRCVFVI